MSLRVASCYRSVDEYTPHRRGRCCRTARKWRLWRDMWISLLLERCCIHIIELILSVFHGLDLKYWVLGYYLWETSNLSRFKGLNRSSWAVVSLYAVIGDRYRLGNGVRWPVYEMGNCMITSGGGPALVGPVRLPCLESTISLHAMLGGNRWYNSIPQSVVFRCQIVSSCLRLLIFLLFSQCFTIFSFLFLFWIHEAPRLYPKPKQVDARLLVEESVNFINCTPRTLNSPGYGCLLSGQPRVGTMTTGKTRHISKI